MLTGGLTAESSHDLVRRMSRPWRPGFGRLAFTGPVSWPAAVSLVSLLSLRPPLFHEQVGVQMMETVSRHFLVLTGVGKATRDAFLRHFAHPHTCVGRENAPFAEPPVSKPFPLWGAPLSRFVRHHPTRSAWATKGFFFFQSPSSRDAPPPWTRINNWSREGPVDPTQGDDREWTNVEDGFSRAASGESQPTVYLESCPVRIRPPPLRRNRKQQAVPAQWPPLGLR